MSEFQRAILLTLAPYVGFILGACFVLAVIRAWCWLADRIMR